MNSKDLYSLLKTVADTKNYSAKMQVLKEAKEEQFLQFVLEASYNFFKNYGYETINLPKRVGTLELSSGEGFQTALEVLNDLNKGRVLNTNLEWFAKAFLEKYNLESQLILIGILTKNIGLKLKPEDIDVIWPTLLPKFAFSGGYVYTNRHRRCIWDNPNDYYVSQLHDGIRCFIIKDWAGNIRMFTKRRRPVVVANRLLNEIKILLRNQYAVVIEGFLKRANEDGEIIKLDQRRLGRTDVQMIRPRFLVFDIFPLKNFIDKRPSPVFSERYQTLKEIFYQMNNYEEFEYKLVTDTDGQMDYKQISKGVYELQYTHLIKQHRVSDKTMRELLVNWRDNKWSGLLFRKDTPFFVGDSSDILKMTKLLIGTYEVVEVLKGRKDYYIKGKRNNLPIVKSLVIKHKKQFVFINFGFDKEFMIKYGANPEALRGKEITVGYTNEDIHEGLRFPLFIKINGDKNEK